MADGVDVDGGGIDMYPDAAAAAVAALAATAANFRQAWLAELGKINGLDSQLGKGPMGRDFAPQYNNVIRQIVEALDELGRRIEERVTFGNFAVAEYRKADDDNAQRFDSV
ncbi:hypothetical protein [Actinophytocola algeriensis]|uniref:Excreted virulence factor EspC (Type VII ESX diderm) n=1 Tax=Actinophytocola algeriensis TaxID=1768010 RepID=A0A7W7Q3W6_9PSEU|nr:hypothetical protein [Actinophytocola algeriensis]MBB4906427.1 hypothetical protein [Actinophytocola algeriensis]MBE1477908.1 hypothetical protein [Actinophytocola algeriensis]